jgi:predicted transport protein
MMSAPDKAMQTMLKNIPDKTGKTLKQWFAILKKSKLVKHGEMMKILKAEYGVTHGFANTIVHLYKDQASAGSSTGSVPDLVAGQYAGSKAGLKPVYDALIRILESFGKDIELAPKKAYVSIRRNKQFAIIQPSTKTRVDVGINLKGEPVTERLEKSGSFNAMVSHRVRITDKKQVNAELKKWLKKAYDAA